MYMPNLCATTRPAPSNLPSFSRIDGQILPRSSRIAPNYSVMGGLGAAPSTSHVTLDPYGTFVRGGVATGTLWSLLPGSFGDEAAFDWLVQYHERGVSRTRQKA